jgi:hypothetical protein
MIAGFPDNFQYVPGMAVAEGDLVMVHGRYTGWGPKPMVAVDIFRIADGRVVEHWDVMQEEVPASEIARNPALEWYSPVRSEHFPLACGRSPPVGCS